MTRTVTLRVTIADEGDPPYEQLRDAIRTKIERGTFGPGDRLPPVRVAAGALGLAPNTVARAYRELESDGWLEGRFQTRCSIAFGPMTTDATSLT